MKLFTDNPRWQAAFLKVVQAPVFSSRQKFEVFEAVIRFVSLLMVNNLIRFQWATKMLGHNHAMFQHIFVASGVGMVGGVNQHVAFATSCASFETRVVGSEAGREVSLQARGGVAAKLAVLDLGSVLPDLSWLAAPTFTNARRNLVSARRVLSWWRIARVQCSQVVKLDEFITRFRLLAASAFTGLHRPYFSIT